MLFACFAAVGARAKVLPGHVPPEIASLQATTAVQSTHVIHLSLALSSRNSNDLAVLIEQLYDPTTPTYRHFLNVDQFADMFGQTTEAYNAVVNFAITNGFAVEEMSANRLLLGISGPAATVERAFNVKLYEYSNSVASTSFYAPNTDPSVPDGLPITLICGLNNYYKPCSFSRRGPPVPGGVVSLGTGSKNGAFIGNDFRAAYIPSVTQTGTGQTVGLFAIDGYDPNDVIQYANDAGITAPTLQTVLLDGTDGKIHRGDNAAEDTLDIDMVNSMAPGLASIISFEGSVDNYNPVHILNAMASYKPKILQFSSSFGWTNDTISGAVDTIFQQMAAQGQAFFEASGDGDANNLGSEFQHPLDNPFITLVGGTALTTSNPGGAWQSEIVWNAKYGLGSGGGVSTNYAIPNWQLGISMANNNGSTTFRNSPDVALVATNFYVYLGADPDPTHRYGWQGTSFSAPLWAGLAALANQRAAASGSPPVGFPSPALYSAAKGYSYTKLFHDVTVGNNQAGGNPDLGPYEAAPGYDLCTGWGTPTGRSILDVLTPIPYSPPSGLIGWWKGDGNSSDSSGVNNGTVWGPMSYAQGEVGFGFDFSPGYNTYPAIDVANVYHKIDVGVGPGFTIEGWIEPTDNNNGRPIFDWSPSPSGGGPHLWASFPYAGELYGNIVDTTGANHIFETSAGILSQNRLQHVALTYDKSSGLGTIYLDGSQVVQSQLGTFTPQTTSDLFLGARDITGGNWAGILDEMSLYNRALSPSEIWNAYASFSQGKACSACSCAAEPSGLVSWWEGEGNCYDHVGNAPGLNPGISQGNLSYGYGEVGTDFYLDGSSDVRILASATLNVGSVGFTIEGWIQPADNQGRPIVEWDSATAFGVHIWANFPMSGMLFANIKDTSGVDHTFQSTSGLLGIGLLHHVALTYDKASGNATIYLDGSAVANKNVGSVVPQTTYDLYLGVRIVGTPTYWLGGLDEITLYNRALSSSEIAAIFHALYNGKCGH